MNWIAAHWEAIGLVLYLLINIVNAASRHYSSHKGVVRALLFVTEVLSIIRSKDQAPGALLGNAKLPLDRPRSGGRALIPFALVASVAMSGCCETARCYLARCQTALAAADPLAVIAIRKVCEPQVAQCTGDPEKCVAFVRCRTAALAYKAARATVGTGLVEANGALEKAGVE